MYGFVFGPGPQVYSLPPLSQELAVPLKSVCANTLDVLKRLRANIAGRGRLGVTTRKGAAELSLLVIAVKNQFCDVSVKQCFCEASPTAFCSNESYNV